MERYEAGKDLLKRGWVPNHTTPFDLVAECRDDEAKLQASLLTYYIDNWGEVRAGLEARMSSHGVDDEAKATFREALDAHEAGLYRAVSRVLFPEFERVFRAVLFGGRAGQIRYNTFVEKLSGEDANLYLEDFMIAGMQDMVLFKYLTEGVRKSVVTGKGTDADDGHRATATVTVLVTAETGAAVSNLQVVSEAIADDGYRRGEAIEIAVTFTEPVTITGTPQLALTIGASTRNARA